MRHFWALMGALAFTVIGMWPADAHGDAKGTYKYTEKLSDGGSIRYTLKLDGNGDAELISQSEGRIRVDNRSIDDYGEVLEDLDRNHKVTHSGTWRQTRSLITLHLEYMQGSRRDVNTRMLGNLDDDELRITVYDKRYYGDRTRFRFERSKSHGSKDAIIAGAAVLALGAILASKKSHSSNNSRGPEGTYTYRDEWNDSRGRVAMRYTLRLHNNGNAELISERAEGLIIANQENREDHGEIIDLVFRNGRMEHSGRWREDGNRIIIDMSRLEGGRYHERDEMRMEGRLSGDRLDINRFDRRLYGERNDFRFEK